MRDSLKAVAPSGTSRCPGGVCREIFRCGSDRPARCVSPCQTPNGSSSWRGWSDGCGVRSTELRRWLRMGPPKHRWCTTCGILHTNVGSLLLEPQSSQPRNHVHRTDHSAGNLRDDQGPDCGEAKVDFSRN